MTLCFGLFVLFACPAAPPVDSFCQVARIIHLTAAERSRMTVESKRQILVHNAKVHRLCHG